MLLNWGIDKAEEMGVPCYLQASSEGEKLYEKFGFEVLSAEEFDLVKYGLEGREMMVEMVRWPKR
jgi:predicted GNAT family N-acyltransferase